MAETPKFEIKLNAIGEVRDIDGNLVSSIPVELTQIVTQEELETLQAEGILP